MPRTRVLVLAALVTAAGCGDPGPKLYPVRGTVVNKGKGSVKDLAGYIIQCQSVADPSYLPGGLVGEDGTFTIVTRVSGKETPGVKEGTYHARLLPQPIEGNPNPPLLVPRRYTKFDTANLQFEVKPGDNDVTFEVDRDK